MVSRIDIGPEGGPFVELDEENGEFVIRVPEDEVNFDQSDITNVKDFTAGSVSTDRINTTPTGARVSISDTQTIAHDTLTTIDWDEEYVRGDIDSVLNDGAIIIPDGFNWAKLTFFFYVGGSVDEMDLELAQIIRGGGEFDGFAGHRTSASPITRELVVGPTAWTPVNSGDEFRARVRHQTGDSRDLSDTAWMEVSLL